MLSSSSSSVHPKSKFAFLNSHSSLATQPSNKTTSPETTSRSTLSSTERRSGCRSSNAGTWPSVSAVTYPTTTDPQPWQDPASGVNKPIGMNPPELPDTEITLLLAILDLSRRLGGYQRTAAACEAKMREIFKTNGAFDSPLLKSVLLSVFGQPCVVGGGYVDPIKKLLVEISARSDIETRMRIDKNKAFVWE